MIPELEQKIRELAYEKWEYRQNNDVLYILDKGELREITEIDDWLEAENEILENPSIQRIKIRGKFE